MSEDRILTTKELALLMRIHPETARRWLRSGHVPARKIGGAWRIVESDLKAFISAGTAAQRKEG